MKSYFEFVKTTFIENWPKELCSLSMAQKGIKLSLNQAEALGTNIFELYQSFPKPHFRDISDIKELIDKEIFKFPNGVFVRLGSRSPKDSLYDSQTQCFTTEDVITRLTACSERIYEDLCLCLNNNYEPYIWLREWKDINIALEFRCFMKNRELIGISQYDYLKGKVYSEVIENKDVIENMIKDYFSWFKQVSYLEDVVFDVYLNKKEVNNLNVWEIKLLEINPFFEMTDPCLFDWRKPEEFKGQFLYNQILTKQ